MIVLYVLDISLTKTYRNHKERRAVIMLLLNKFFDRMDKLMQDRPKVVVIPALILVAIAVGLLILTA